MDDGDVQAARASAPGDLHETAGIPRRDDRGSRLGDPRHLELEELARDPWLEDVVDSRAPAAEVALRELHEPEAGDPPEELPRLLAHALAVGEVTGIVIRHGQLEATEWQWGVREQLRHVARPQGKPPRLPHPVAVLLHRRAAPRRVGHDPVDVGERRHEPSRARAEVVDPARVELERAAAALGARDHDVPTCERQQARRVPVDVGEQVAPQLSARRLEERPEADARGTRGLARPAAETEVEVTGEGLGQPDPALGRGPHEIDPAARRVHLLAQHPVRRTLGQADPAVDTLPDLLEVGSVRRDDDGRRHQSPPTKRPGLSTRLASNSSLSPRISAKASGSSGPQGSTAARTAAGARWMTTLPPTGATSARRRSTSALTARGSTVGNVARRLPRVAEPVIAAAGPAAATARSVSAAVSPTRVTRVPTASAIAPSGVVARPYAVQKLASSGKSVAPASRAKRETIWPWARTASSAVAIETATAAGASPAPQAPRAARFRSSTRFGWTVESTRRAMKACAAARSLKAASHVASKGGAGWSRSVSSPRTPRVPRAPTMSFGTS